jgi:hypothetical protein
MQPFISLTKSPFIQQTQGFIEKSPGGLLVNRFAQQHNRTFKISIRFLFSFIAAVCNNPTFRTLSTRNNAAQSADIGAEELNSRTLSRDVLSAGSCAT